MKKPRTTSWAQRFSVELTLIEPLLGTVSANKEVYAQYIATKAPKAKAGLEEIDTIKEREGRGWTTFAADETGLFLWDYQVKGMLKELARIAFPRDNAAGLKAVSNKIEQFVYVRPRRIPLGVKTPDEVVERPLRAQTMQGPRTTVVRSDAVRAGRMIRFEIHILPGQITDDHLRAVLAVGEYRGLGQWRTGSWGRFTFRISPVTDGKA